MRWVVFSCESIPKIERIIELTGVHMPRINRACDRAGREAVPDRLDGPNSVIAELFRVLQTHEDMLERYAFGNRNQCIAIDESGHVGHPVPGLVDVEG